MIVKGIDVKVVHREVANLPILKARTTNEATVRAWYADMLSHDSVKSMTSVKLSAAGCSNDGFPPVACAKIVAQEILRAAREGRGDLKEIEVCLDTEEMFQVFDKHVYGYLSHMTQELGMGPYVTVDVIIEVDGGIILIERTNPPFGWALPGGFVDNGESLETAVRREAKEEVNLILSDLKQFHTYSEPARDPRFHTVSTVFTAWGLGRPMAGDDAKAYKVVPFAELRKIQYAFDHAKIVGDFLTSRGI